MKTDEKLKKIEKDQFKAYIALLNQIFPDTNLNKKQFFDFIKNINEGIITIDKFNVIKKNQHLLEQHDWGRRILSSPENLIYNFNSAYELLQKLIQKGVNSKKAEWTKDKVVEILGKYNHITKHNLENFKKENFDYGKFFEDKPVWPILTTLASDFKIYVLPIIGKNKSVYKKLVSEIRNNKQLFKILRDDLKMINLPKYLNEPID